MAGTGGGGANKGGSTTPVVNTWDKTITVTTGNSARGNSVTRTIPNPNYIDRTKAPASAADTFKKLLASGEIKPVYGQKDVSRGQGGGTDRVTDTSKFQGYQRTLPDGRVEAYDATGKSLGIRTPNTGGGGLFGAIGGAISNITGGISDAVSTVSRDIASSPEAMAIITAIAASQGVDPATTAAVLGANRAGKDGNIQAGLETAALSYALGSNVSPTNPTGATTAPVTSGSTVTTPLTGTTTAAGGTTSSLLPGGLTGGVGSTTGLNLPAGAQFTGLGLETAPLAAGLQAGGGAGLTAGSTIGSALSTSLAANSLAPSLGATGMLGAAQAAGTATGMLGAAQAAGTATGASKVAGSLIPGISDGLLSTGLNTLGGLIQGQSATDAAKSQSDAIIKAAQIAADAAKFKPVGVTTGFGSSKFGFDANGNLTSAGYELTPEMKAQRDALIGTSSGLLDQFRGAQAATAGMGTAAQTAMQQGQNAMGVGGSLFDQAQQWRPDINQVRQQTAGMGTASQAAMNMGNQQLTLGQNALNRAEQWNPNINQVRQQTAGMGTAAQRSMALGNQYLATDPQAQAQKYYADQMALLNPTRAADMAALQAQMQAQGRGGFAIGGGVGGQGAANPQLQALLNAQLQQNNQIAANATQGGMDYAKFGAGLAGTGGDLMNAMYATQSNAYNPYKTAMGVAQNQANYGIGAVGAGGDLLSSMYNTQANAYNPYNTALNTAMNTSKYGAGMVGTGGDLLSSMYGTQTAAFNPYQTALGGAQTIEGLGQNALTLGMDMGKTTTAANTAAGGLLGSGMTQAANTMAPANAYSPWANLLAGGAQALQQYKFGQ